VLIVLATVLVLGIAWFTVGALGKVPVTSAQRETRTGRALQAGKQALLAHVAQYAARSSTSEPGQLPCPESLTYTATTEGQASTSCSNATETVGRLPWRTLGIDQLRDADGEPLWYVLSRGFRNAPVNFATVGQIGYNGAANAAVALVVAPGQALNTLADPAAPPAACAKVNQRTTNRYDNSVNPLDPTKFLECGNATGSYANPGNATPSWTQWSNDRVLVITQAEWADAIAGAVADRIQRQVAPAMEDYRTTTSLASWGDSFLPHASTWDSVANSPLNNDLCGDLNERSGMPPTATITDGTCATDWSSGSATGLAGLLSFGGCVPGASDIRCSFTAILGGLITPRITVVAPRIANSFRSFDRTTIQISRNGGAWQSGTVLNYTGNVSPASGNATVRFDIAFPLLSIADNVIVRIPNPTDALQPDPRVAWFLDNNWDRYAYYAVTRAATTNPGGSICNPGGVVTDCLTVNGMTAPVNDKRLVLALMGRAPIAPATWPSASPADYLEGANATPADRDFEVRTVTVTFNDRLAACPFRYTDAGGTPIVICN
jgi:hypothetical protein